MSRRDDGLLLGIEIGGTKLQLGLGRHNGHLIALERRRIEPSRGASGVLAQIHEAYHVLLDIQAARPESVVAAGVGFGGPVDVDRGRIRTSYQVEGWVDFPLADWIRQQLGVAAAEIQNDADTAGLAEAHLGAGVGFSPILYLTIGSGIGGALIVDGRIYRGCGLGAVEIGHTEVPDLAEPGSFKELEQVASGWGLTRYARDLVVHMQRGSPWIVMERSGNDPSAITAEMIAQAAIEGDPRAILIMERAQHALAHALRQAIAMLGPRRIILGGGVSLIGESHWFEPIRKKVEASVFAPFRGSYEIVPAALGEEVVVHGALIVARDLASQAARQSSSS